MIEDINLNIDETNLPENIYILPLQTSPVFPGLFTPLVIHDEEDIESVKQVSEGNGYLGLSLLKDEDDDPSNPENLYSIGTLAKIIKTIKLPTGGLNIFVSTVKRYEVTEYYVLDNGDGITAHVNYLDDILDKPLELKAMTRQLTAEMKGLAKNNPMITEEIRLNLVNIEDPGKLSDFLASILTADRFQQQNILELVNVRKRMEKILVLIQKEQNIMNMQREIKARVNRKIDKHQREYFLKEELKQIQSELNGGNPQQKLLDKLKKKIEKLNLTGEAKEEVDYQYERLASLDSNNPEYTITKTYLETVVALPWNTSTEENYSIKKARDILEADHYGLKDVKDRILEFLAVRKLKDDKKGSIICLVGPPGVGKTSIGKSIASALDKKYYRFSVGGMRDEAEIKGHRRTYIGAIPGKIIQGLKICKTNNPLFLIDEIDKMGQSYNGDPASALLEVLDPEQNVAFRDRYLDLPFDVSNVLFIVTANTLETIPRPLIDRMEIIPLTGYTSDEKLAIGKKYLVPKALKKHGLTKKDIVFRDAALNEIANSYAREAGVRNFEKQIWKISRKVALKLAEEKDVKKPVAINKKGLEEYLGQKVFDESNLIVADIPGTSIGLAWTSMGGDTLLIEAKDLVGKGMFTLTGRLGDVMQESARIAFNYIKSISFAHGIEYSWFSTHDVHLHVPEGATPKDGPSAGVTMATAFYGLVTNQVMAPHVAMTGELSLTGKVMPIGGLKEKLLAARRNKIKTVIIPEQNKTLLSEIDDSVKDGFTFVLAKTWEDVRKVAYPNDKFPLLSNFEVQKNQDELKETTQEQMRIERAKVISLALEAFDKTKDSK